MITDKLFWVWDVDGSILYVKRAYYTRFTKRLKMETVDYFYTSSFDDVVKVAEDFIARVSTKV